MQYNTSESQPIYNESILKMKEVAIIASDRKERFGLENDSIITHCYMPSKMEKDLFLSVGRKPVSLQEKLLTQETSFSGSLISLLPLVMFASIVLTKAIYPRRFFQMISASFSNNAQWQLLREWYPINNGLTYLYTFLYFIGFALLIQSIAEQTGGGLFITGNNYLDLLILFGGVSFIISGKYITIMTLAVIFNSRESGERYLTNQITFTLISVLLMIPIILVLNFQTNEWSLIGSVVLLGLAQLARIIRSMRVGLTEKAFGLLYLFLYLCALEIVPLLVLVKVFLLITNGEAFG
ncbi:MAG: hypothetical protein FD155_1036 [Bacteroidetes bacterium]|nr:MAG: hypothetical protein FD155_1036 [Bacteroidota bacterium]